MEDEIQIDNLGELISVKVSGEYSLEKLISVINLMDEVYKAQPFTKVLYDFRLMQGYIGAMDRIKIVIYAAKFSNRRVKSAILNKLDHISTSRLLANYLSNFGMMIKVFSNKAEALSWLKE